MCIEFGVCCSLWIGPAFAFSAVDGLANCFFCDFHHSHIQPGPLEWKRVIMQAAADAAAVKTPSAGRLLILREHGSWGLWILPLISGAVVGFSVSHERIAPLAWFYCMSACVFLLNQPLEVLLGLSVLKIRNQHERRAVIAWLLGFGALALLSAVQLLQWGFVWLIALVLVGGIAFAQRAFLGFSRRYRVLKELIGTIALTSTAAGAYYVVTGVVTETAILLWLASSLFAVGQIEYVQLRLRTASPRSRPRKYEAGRKLLALHMAVILLALIYGPILLAVAFVPAALRIIVWMSSRPQPLHIHRLGWTELLQNVVFTALLTAAYL